MQEEPFGLFTFNIVSQGLWPFLFMQHPTCLKATMDQIWVSSTILSSLPLSRYIPTTYLTCTYASWPRGRRPLHIFLCKNHNTCIISSKSKYLHVLTSFHPKFVVHKQHQWNCSKFQRILTFDLCRGKLFQIHVIAPFLVLFSILFGMPTIVCISTHCVSSRCLWNSEGT
jgi:hypothetical protein